MVYHCEGPKKDERVSSVIVWHSVLIEGGEGAKRFEQQPKIVFHCKVEDRGDGRDRFRCAQDTTHCQPRLLIRIS